jgi:5-formyltetrahydrofolate cyclo-ligase
VSIDDGDESPDRLKASLRAICRTRRKMLGPVERERETAATVAACLRLIDGAGAAAIGSYFATGTELDLAALHQSWWNLGRTVWLPRVAGPGRLTWHGFGPVAARNQAALVPGFNGLREPDPLVVPAQSLPADALLLVPGIAFGADGRRLGQGGGYYDRALAVHPGPAIGVGFACQRRDELPIEGHDLHLAAIVLGGEVVRAPAAWVR